MMIKKDSNKPITLYINTHNITGLKYFGKTNRFHSIELLQNSYHGSGTKWLEHLEIFGDDISIDILGTYPYGWVHIPAILFSIDNDIVKSERWANSKIENGHDGGGVLGSKRRPLTDKEKANLSLKIKGFKHKPEALEKIRESSAGRKHSEETKENMSKRLQSTGGNMLGRKHREDSKEKMSNTRKGRIVTLETREKLSKPRPKIKCPYCDKIGGANVMPRWHFEKCKYKS